MRNNRALLLYIVLLVFITSSVCGCKEARNPDVSSAAVSSGISEAEKIEQAYKQELSFSPDANSDETNDAVIKEHINRLKTIDKNGAVREGVNFVGYNAQRSENGDLVVYGYLRNFSGSEIYNIECNITVQNSETQEYVAVKSFKFYVSPENAPLCLENKKSCPVTITFDSDFVNADNADLSKLSFSSEITYSQK